jgi:hypothetical protein
MPRNAATPRGTEAKDETTGRLRIVEASRTVSAGSIDVSMLDRYLEAA